MKQKNIKLLIFIVHDGIKNSVFTGQVLQPTLQKIKNQTIDHVLLISFEKESISQDYIYNLIKNNIPQNSNISSSVISTITLKRSIFWGKFSLRSAISQLTQVLKKYRKYNVIARGPIAGFIAAKSINFLHCNNFTIQARGLLAQEYDYAHKNEKNPLKKIIHKARYYIFHALEKKTYQLSKKLPNTQIESVSHALKNHLINNFGANQDSITLANSDIPSQFEKNQITTWRTHIRQKLQIPANTTIYCYNGSIKPWQCPEKVIDFFKKKLQNPCYHSSPSVLKKRSKKIFLLILTQHTKEFETLIKQANIPRHTYLIKTIDHNKIYQYLAACDYGIIFREPNIVNWVSRPTKVLEYRAVGLKIIHNNTVGILCK